MSSATLGCERQAKQARIGMAERGLAKCGLAKRGLAKCGVVLWSESKAGTDKHGVARTGPDRKSNAGHARRSTARPGTVWHGADEQGKAGKDKPVIAELSCACQGRPG